MRLFLAIPVPLDVAAVAAPLEGPQFRPVPPASAHMTVRFFGEADPDAVANAMEGFQARIMEARFTKAGAFPGPRRARVAWLGVAAEGLHELAADVRRRVQGIGEPDRKDFVAHTTLGRFRGPVDVSDALASVAVPQEAFQLDRVELMASELTRQGPRYNVVRAWDLEP